MLFEMVGLEALAPVVIPFEEVVPGAVVIEFLSTNNPLPLV